MQIYVCWLETGDRLVLGLDFVREAAEKIDIIRARMRKLGLGRRAMPIEDGKT